METQQMKMMMIVLPRKHGDNFLAALIGAGYTATMMETRGGMLRQSQLTLYVAVKSEKVNEVIGLIRATTSDRALIYHGFGISNPSKDEIQGDPYDFGQSDAVVFLWSLDSLEIP